jgi:hypothetical protein
MADGKRFWLGREFAHFFRGERFRSQISKSTTGRGGFDPLVIFVRMCTEK